ncbi:MAG: glycerol-3-phosphate 1-O-acyltransferase PlsY [Clostridia bacterium]|nr:glycerol-3-phosphate 1-O-acyltransferase PlsY [Clostridia bacterium]MBO7250687.1 glycerol-3-phosphate 1-O-acyltransferase PlsY [Clostridia bacterium]
MTFNEFFSTGLFGGFLFNSALDEATRAIWLLIFAIICIAAPYFLGSMNFAIIISKKVYKKDIRAFGSGNAGATNMMRTFGKRTAVFTLLGDALKAVVSGFLGYALLGQYGAYIAGLFCILGHMFPIYYRFKGGKGVVTTAVSMLMCNPFVFLILLVIFVIIVGFSKYISLGSVMCALLYPVVLDRIEKIFNGGSGAYVIITIIIAALVIFMHKDNIKRLMNGEESKFSFKKSVDPNKEINKGN